MMVASLPPTWLDALRDDPDSVEFLAKRTLCVRHLYEFVKEAWPSIDSAPFEESWAVRALSLHLEAVTRGEVQRFLANYPPRCSKTIVTSVCWPIWTWLQSEISTTSGPGVRFLCASYNDDLSLDAADKMRRLIDSPWFQERWGDKIKIRRNKGRKSDFANEQGGGRISTSMKGGIIGRGGDIVLVDDPHNTQTAESDADRLTTSVAGRNCRRPGSTTRRNPPSSSSCSGFTRKT